jgi:hypothetical protein
MKPVVSTPPCLNGSNQNRTIKMENSKIHEDLLRHLWSGQYLDAERLATIDGRFLKVIQPGTLNRGSGPDFRDAIVVLEGKTLRGDIEFHRSIADWKAHSHDVDAKYNSVILHVVLRGNSDVTSTLSASGRPIPVLMIEQYLSYPLEKILEHTMRDEHVSLSAPLRCFHRNDGIDIEVLDSWIRRLFAERLKEKETRMLARLYQIIDDRHRGVFEPEVKYNENPDDIPVSELSITKEELKQSDAWDQLLYGAIMDGLGYSKNRAPFKELAHRVSIQRLRLLSASRELTQQDIEAILFRMSGLLPASHELNDQQSKVHVHLLQSLWKELNADVHSARLLSVEPLPATDWVFTPTRPSNFPTVRIAAASHFLTRILHGQMVKHIITIIAGVHSSTEEKLDQMLSLFDIAEESFWNYHYSFTDSFPQRRSLLGNARRLDIIINAIIPLSNLYGNIFGIDVIGPYTSRIAEAIPLLENNAVVRKIENQLLKGKLRLRAAHEQQGAIQLYRRYCVMGRCNECEVGKRVFGE